MSEKMSEKIFKFLSIYGETHIAIMGGMKGVLFYSTICIGVIAGTLYGILEHYLNMKKHGWELLNFLWFVFICTTLILLSIIVPVIAALLKPEPVPKPVMV